MLILFDLWTVEAFLEFVLLKEEEVLV